MSNQSRWIECPFGCGELVFCISPYDANHKCFSDYDPNVDNRISLKNKRQQSKKDRYEWADVDIEHLNYVLWLLS